VAGNLTRPEVIVEAAKNRGLLLTGPSAKEFILRVTKEQRVYDNLGKNGYQELPYSLCASENAPGPLQVIDVGNLPRDEPSLIPAPMVVDRRAGSGDVPMMQLQLQGKQIKQGWQPVDLPVRRASSNGRITAEEGLKAATLPAAMDRLLRLLVCLCAAVLGGLIAGCLEDPKADVKRGQRRHERGREASAPERVSIRRQSG
jgi:hypothetical protein